MLAHYRNISKCGTKLYRSVRHRGSNPIAHWLPTGYHPLLWRLEAVKLNDIIAVKFVTESILVANRIEMEPLSVSKTYLIESVWRLVRETVECFSYSHHSVDLEDLTVPQNPLSCTSPFVANCFISPFLWCPFELCSCACMTPRVREMFCFVSGCCWISGL